MSNNAVWVTGIAIIGICWLIETIVSSRRKQKAELHEHERDLAMIERGMQPFNPKRVRLENQHAERLAMIERGMMPPDHSSDRMDQEREQTRLEATDQI